jgi:hypothetical protein
MVMQTGQDRDRDDGIGPLHRPTKGRILAQRHVRADLIVVSRIRRQSSSKMRPA